MPPFFYRYLTALSFAQHALLVIPGAGTDNGHPHSVWTTAP